MALFRDRIDAGRHLAAKLLPYTEGHRTVVVGLARGGVPVAEQIALALGVDFDVLVMCKVGVPGRSELTMATVTSGGVEVVEDDVVEEFEIGKETLRRTADDARREVIRREQVYRGDREPKNLVGKMVVLVDDGVATGTTMRAAVAAVRLQTPARVLVAVPVAPILACEELKVLADAMVTLHSPQPFYSIDRCYEEFPKTTDEQVREALARSWRVFVRPDSSVPV